MGRARQAIREKLETKKNTKKAPRPKRPPPFTPCDSRPLTPPISAIIPPWPLLILDPISPQPPHRVKKKATSARGTRPQKGRRTKMTYPGVPVFEIMQHCNQTKPDATITTPSIDDRERARKFMLAKGKAAISSNGKPSRAEPGQGTVLLPRQQFFGGGDSNQDQILG